MSYPMSFPPQGIVVAPHRDTHEPEGTDEVRGIDIPNAPAVNLTGWGLETTETVGENVVAGEVLCVKADAEWWKTDADDATIMPGEGLAMEDALDGEECRILLSGIFRDDSWGWTPGSRLYLSSTPGDMTHTRPIGKYKQYQSVGKALTATVIHFNPFTQEHKETPFCGGCGEELLAVGYSSMNGVQPVTDNPDKSYIALPYAGVLIDLRCRLTTVPGAGTSWTFTVYKSFADTALTVTISDAEASAEDTMNTVALTVDDRICMHITKTGAPADTYASWSAHYYRT